MSPATSDERRATKGCRDELATRHASLVVSIIIPALDEEETLPATLASALGQPGPKEIIVADGGSGDATRQIAGRAGVTVVCAPRGRARQMNAGAAMATGDALLFLHADTQLPDGALDCVREALHGGSTAGCFRLRFDRGGFWLWLWSRPAWMHWHRWAFGDRALFVRRTDFDAVGGFPDQPIFEELDLVRSLRRRGRFAFLPEAVVTSARRFEAVGALRQQLRNWALWGAWCLGVDPERVARFYPTHKQTAGTDST
ncbi:MAG: TIGR04283 family arsenosugar biosynthesis glycosyltransferase [Bacteroidota bacterium]